MRKKKILFAVSDAGFAHRMAANALVEAIKKKYPDHEARFEMVVLDWFKELHVPPFSTSDKNHELISKNWTAVTLYDLLFQITNTSRGFKLAEEYVKLMVQPSSLALMNELKPDIVISTHNITSALFSSLKRSHHGNAKDFKLVSVVLELATIHRSWADNIADVVVAPTEVAIELLVKNGIDRAKIIGPLYPIRPSLMDYKSKAQTFKQLQFDPNIKTLLLTAGGVGAEKIVAVTRKLLKWTDYQIIVICGGQLEVEAKLKPLAQKHPQLRVLGFVDNMQDYYEAVDLAVIKPGSTTVLEVEAFGKIAVLTGRLGIHEQGNLEYALANPFNSYLGNNSANVVPVINAALNRKLDGVSFKPRRRFTESLEIIEQLEHIL